MIVHETSFVDDMAQPILGPASTILDRVANTTTKVFEVFCAFALEMNFKAGKSEATIQFVGKGSKLARAQLSKDSYRVALPVIGPDIHLNVVESYKHVGTHDNIRNEVTTRLNIMTGECRALRKVLRKVSKD